MEMKSIQSRLDILRNACGQETAKYFEIPEGKFDPSALLMAQYNEKGEMVLFMPAMNRWRWFKMEHPDALIAPRDPVFVSRIVTVSVDIYLNSADKAAQRVYCSGACSSLLTDDVHLVNSMRTRAVGNAMRNVGYDIPMSAHYIEGWTEVCGANESVPEEAMESGVRIIPAIPPVTLVKTAQTTNPPSETPAASETEAVEEKASAPVKGKKEPKSRKKVAAPAESASVSEEAPRPIESAPAPQQAEKEEVAPEATASEAPMTEPPKVEAEDMTSAALNNSDEDVDYGDESVDAAENSQANAKPEIYSRSDVEQMLQEAKETFGGVVGAENFTHPVFCNAAVGEQTDLRVRYFAQKGIAGSLSERKLALATLLVAYERGLIL